MATAKTQPVLTLKALQQIDWCRPVSSRHAETFAWILDTVTGLRGSTTDYILDNPARCPNCRHEITVDGSRSRSRIVKVFMSDIMSAFDLAVKTSAFTRAADWETVPMIPGRKFYLLRAAKGEQQRKGSRRNRLRFLSPYRKTSKT